MLQMLPLLLAPRRSPTGDRRLEAEAAAREVATEERASSMEAWADAAEQQAQAADAEVASAMEVAAQQAEEAAAYAARKPANAATPDLQFKASHKLPWLYTPVCDIFFGICSPKRRNPSNL